MSKNIHYATVANCDHDRSALWSPTSLVARGTTLPHVRSCTLVSCQLRSWAGADRRCSTLLCNGRGIYVTHKCRTGCLREAVTQYVTNVVYLSFKFLIPYSSCVVGRGVYFRYKHFWILFFSAPYFKFVSFDRKNDYE